MKYTTKEFNTRLTADILKNDKNYTFELVKENVINTNIPECATLAIVNKYNNFLTDKGYLFVYDKMSSNKYYYHLYYIFDYVNSKAFDEIEYQITNQSNGMEDIKIENKSIVVLYKSNELKRNNYFIYYAKPEYIGIENKKYLYKFPFSGIKYYYYDINDNNNYKLAAAVRRADGFYETNQKIDKIVEFYNESKSTLYVSKHQTNNTLGFTDIQTSTSGYDLEKTYNNNTSNRIYYYKNNNGIYHNYSNTGNEPYFYFYSTNAQSKDVLLVEVC